MPRQAPQRGRGTRTAQSHARPQRRAVDRPLSDRLRHRARGPRRQPCYRAFQRLLRPRHRALHRHRRAVGGGRLLYAGRLRRRVHRRHRGRSARHHRPEPAVGPAAGRRAGCGMDGPVERGPRRSRSRTQSRRRDQLRQRFGAAQGERASAGRRLDRLRLRPPPLGTQRRLRRAAGPSGRRDGPRDACGDAASRAVERRRRHLGHPGRRHGGRRERHRGCAARKLRGGQHHPRGHRGGRRLPGGPRQLGLHHRVRVREARSHGHAARQ